MCGRKFRGQVRDQVDRELALCRLDFMMGKICVFEIDGLDVHMLSHEGKEGGLCECLVSRLDLDAQITLSLSPP